MAQSGRRLEPQDYALALQAESLGNASAVIHRLSWVLDGIWEEAQASGEGTAWVNQHPIIRLYAQRLLELSSPKSLDAAVAQCQEQANGTGH